MLAIAYGIKIIILTTYAITKKQKFLSGSSVPGNLSYRSASPSYW